MNGPSKKLNKGNEAFLRLIQATSNADSAKIGKCN